MNLHILRDETPAKRKARTRVWREMRALDILLSPHTDEIQEDVETARWLEWNLSRHAEDDAEGRSGDRGMGRTNIDLDGLLDLMDSPNRW